MHLKRSLHKLLLQRISVVKIQKQNLATQQNEKIFESTFESIPIPAQNIADYCMNRFDPWLAYPAMECSVTGKMFTYADIRNMAKQFGSFLLDSGLVPGDKIAVMVPNCPEFGPLLLGSLGVGVTLVPISPMLGPKEVARLLDIAKPRMVITNDDILPSLSQALALVSADLKIGTITISDHTQSSATPFEEVLKNDGSGYDKRPNFDLDKTLGILPFSSGTTGLPKGVMLNHSKLTSSIHLTNNRQSGCARDPFDPKINEKQFNFLSVIPMFHIFGLTMNVLQPLSAGAHSISMPKFEAPLFISILEKHQPFFMNLVPPLVMMLANHPAITKEKHLAGTRVVSSGGSPISSLVLEKLWTKLHPDCEFKEGYGMTECPIIARTQKGGRKPNSCGKLVSNVKAKVVDLNSGDSVGVDQPGELWIKAPHVTEGYFQNEEANTDAFSDGWFRTGDVVVIDEEHNLFIVDRIKDMIKVKGYQVAPTELEDEIREAPGVADVAVIGVKDDRAGEVPKAFIVPTSKDVTEESIQEFLTARLAKYKQLKGGIVFLEALPKTPTGKILRKELRSL